MNTDVNELIEAERIVIDEAERSIALLMQNRTLIETHDYELVLARFSKRVVFELNPKEPFTKSLTKARQFMKQLLGAWSDELESIWCPYGDKVIVSWHTKGEPIFLWLECTIDTLPEELKKSDSCHWAETKTSQKNYVCEL